MDGSYLIENSDVDAPVPRIKLFHGYGSHAACLDKLPIRNSYVKLPEAYFISLTRIQLTLSVDVPILNQSLLSGGIGGQNLQETHSFYQ